MTGAEKSQVSSSFYAKKRCKDLAIVKNLLSNYSAIKINIYQFPITNNIYQVPIIHKNTLLQFSV